MTSSLHTTDATTSLARLLTHDISPEEDIFFDEIIASDKSSNSTQDHTLGFGVSDLASQATSSIMLVVAQVAIGFLWQNGKDAAGNLIKEMSLELADHCKRKFAQWLNSDEDKEPMISLNKVQLNALTREIEDHTRETNLTQEQRSRLLEAVTKIIAVE